MVCDAVGHALGDAEEVHVPACVALVDCVGLRLGLAVGVGVPDVEGVWIWLGDAVAERVTVPVLVGLCVPLGVRAWVGDSVPDPVGVAVVESVGVGVWLGLDVGVREPELLTVAEGLDDLDWV